MTQKPPPSHLAYYPDASCHLLACQFEKQWLPQARLFADSVEQALPFIALWHLPPSHRLFLPPLPNSLFEAWIQEANPPNVERSIDRLPSDSPIQLFGISPLALASIQEKGATSGTHPPVELIRTLHDKRFIEQARAPLDPQLPSGWIEAIDELISIKNAHRTKRWMVKRPWASAGRGNLTLEPDRPLPIKTLQRWLDFDRGWIVHPFVERLVDFSSLWWIHEEGTVELFSTTRMQVSNDGRYLGCWLGGAALFQEALPWIETHLGEARDFLKQVHEKGYFGPIGLDGMVYLDSRGTERQAIIEMNVRQTLAMHLVSAAQALYPDFRNSLILSARLLAPSQKRTGERLLLPPIPGAFNLSIQPVS